MAYDAWISVSSISYQNVLAFGPGEIIPDSHVTRYHLDTLGLVARVSLPDAAGPGVPVEGLDPVTQRELDALTTGNGRLSDAALRAALESRVSRAGATTGQVPVLQPDGTLAFATAVGGGGVSQQTAAGLAAGMALVFGA